MVGAVSVAVAGAFFGLTAMNAGEFNYQGGDRKTFYTAFPFDGSKDNVWDRKGTEMSTNDSDADSVLQDFPNRFAHNVEYFLIGRHFGFVPYFFPGALAIVLWLFSRERRRPWRLLIFLAVVGSAIGLLIFAPYSWSGGGGPTGNRYIIGVYAAMFFLTPPMTSIVPAILAWIGGALFTAKMLVNPFVAAKSPYLATERGFARWLPVEVTMANDLPIMLIEGPRAHSWFNDVLLYFLDEHAYPPEVIDAAGHTGVWIAGDGRADIIMRSDWPIDHLRMTVESRVPTVFIVSAGGGAGPRAADAGQAGHLRRAGVGRARLHQLRLPAVGALDRRVHRAPAEPGVEGLSEPRRADAVHGGPGRGNERRARRRRRRPEGTRAWCWPAPRC